MMDTFGPGEIVSKPLSVGDHDDDALSGIFGNKTGQVANHDHFQAQVAKG